MSKKIGIIGGGQLGRMLTEAATTLEFETIVLDPSENSPAAKVGAKQILGSLSDEGKIQELAETVDYLTWEIEHINTRILESLSEKGFSINPSPKTLVIIKDKLSQSEFLEKFEIPTASFKRVESGEDVLKAAEEFGYPLVLKSRFGGYDGRGNFVIENAEQVKEGFKTLGEQNLYVEKFVEFEKELAIMAARDTRGNVVTYPVVETIHKNNILHYTLAPAPISPKQRKDAEEFAKKVLKHLEGAGVFGIEMFLAKDGSILVNEIAPRVHNSGHYTIEACETSQFEQHIRAITGMELGATQMVVPCAVMVNILGDRDAAAQVEGLHEALAIQGVSVHIYGKAKTKPQRKMGHITVTGDNIDEVFAKAKSARSLINI